MLHKLARWFIILALLCTPIASICFAAYEIELSQSQITGIETGLEETVVEDLYIKFVNFSKDTTYTFELASADGSLSQTGKSLKTYDNKRNLGKWIDLSEFYVTIPPNSEKTVEFDLRIPPFTRPGKYFGGIFTYIKPQTNNSTEIPNGSSVSLRLAHQHLLDIEISGNLYTEYQLINFINRQPNSRTESFSYTFDNLGSTYLKFYTEVAIRNNQDQIVKTHQDNGQITPPLSSKNFQFQWNNSPLFGTFNSNVKIDIYTYDPETETEVFVETINKEFTTSHFPIYEFLLITTIISLISTILFLIYFYKHHHHLKTEFYQVKSDDSISKVAKKFGMNWKYLAKLNRIKPPFNLSPNSVLKVINRKKTTDE